MMVLLSPKETGAVVLGMVVSAAAVFGGTVAHWTFEEGPVGTDVSLTGRGDPVRDVLGNGNDLRAPDESSAPTYLADSPSPWTAGTGEPNHLGLHFTSFQHLVSGNKAINEHPFPEWTVEAAFKPHQTDRWQVIVGKDGDPLDGPPPFAMKILAPSGRLELGVVDGGGTWRLIQSQEPLVAGRWHRAVGVADAGAMSLWLKGPGDPEYVFQGSVPMDGAWYGDAGSGSWTIGRGMWDGEPADGFGGVIDEVRVSDEALESTRFLAVGERSFRPAGVKAGAGLATDPAGGRARDHPVLSLELGPEFPGDPDAIFLEGSSGLETWEPLSFTPEAIEDGEGTLQVNLVGNDALSDLPTPYFLRGRFAATAPHNPVLPGADPAVLLVDDTLWVYPTYRSGEQRFFAFSSTDLVTWRIHGPILDFADVDWMPGGKFAWAPGVVEKDGRFYLYFSAGPKPSYIGVAVADSPAGPFVDSGEPLLFDNNDPEFEAIDAMVFTDPESETSYFYAGGSAGATLRVFELDESVTGFVREIDVATPPNFTEGPFVHYRDGMYFLSYSDGIWWDGSYEVHYATSETPYGPWNYRGVIMESDENHRGPGHHSIVYNPGADEWYIVYHRWNDETEPGPYDGRRKVAIERLEYDENGLMKPVTMTNTGVAPTRLNAEPAGE